MAKSNHLVRRESIYYFRRKIPVDLLQHYPGKREIVRSLGTKDYDEAARIARRVSADLDEAWEALRNDAKSKQADAARIAQLFGEPAQPNEPANLDPGNSIAMVNKKIGFVRLLLGVGKSRGLIEVNHAEGAERPVGQP